MLISQFASHFPEGTLSLAKDCKIEFLAYDSRAVVKNSAFFCFSGTQTNGNKYIKEAISNGATLIVTNEVEELISGISYFITKTSIRTLYAKASAFFFDYPATKLSVIGITGTDGKSSTSDFTYQLLNKLGYKIGLSSTVFVDIGEGKSTNNFHQSTPEAFVIQSLLAKAVENNCKYFVLEATSHALSKEYDRLNSIEYSYCAYTTISSEHLEFHKTYHQYIEAKANLAKKTQNKVLIYSNNKALSEIKAIAGDKLYRLTPPLIIKQELEELEFLYEDNLYMLPFGQNYNLENAFEAASLVSLITNKPLNSVLPLLRNLTKVKGRFTLVPNSIGRTIIVDFAHTPDSYHKVLSECRKLNHDSSFIAVFGSSGKRDCSKRAQMGLEIARYCSAMIITEDDPRGEDLTTTFNELTSAIPPFLKTRINIIQEDDRTEAIRKALALSQTGDFIFLLGVGAQTQIDYGTYTKPWNEVETVSKLLREMSCCKEN